MGPVSVQLDEMLQSNVDVLEVESIVQPLPTPNLSKIVRHPVRPIKVPFSLVIVAEGWPCWLPSVSALQLPISGGYFPPRLHKLFPNIPHWSQPQLMSRWKHTNEFLRYTENHHSLPSSVCLLIWGSIQFYHNLLARLQEHPGPFIFAIDTDFSTIREHHLTRSRGAQCRKARGHNFQHATARHADFGGATNASHLLFFRDLPSMGFAPSTSMPRVLKHLLNSATQGWFPVLMNLHPCRVQ